METFHNVLIAVQSNWLGNFGLNLLGYALIIGPAALLIQRLKKNPLVERGCYLFYSNTYSKLAKVNPNFDLGTVCVRPPVPNWLSRQS